MIAHQDLTEQPLHLVQEPLVRFEITRNRRIRSSWLKYLDPGPHRLILVVLFCISVLFFAFHSGCSLTNRDPAKEIQSYRASLAIRYLAHDGLEVVEIIELQPKSIVYLYASYQVRSLDSCTSFADGRHRCAVVRWGFSQAVPARDDIRATHHNSLLRDLLRLRPFELAEYYEPGRAGQSQAEFRISLRETEGEKQHIVRSAWYHPWDDTSPVQRVFQFMLSLKKDVIFFPDELDIISTVKNLNDRTFVDGPYGKVVKIASIIEIWKHNYRRSIPVLRKLLQDENDPEVKECISSVLLAWSKSGSP